VWTGHPGSIGALAVAGDPTPGRPDEALNADAEVCFVNGIRSGHLGNNQAIFAGPAGKLAPVVRKGEPIPGMPGFTWDSLGKPRINDRGDIAFEAIPKPGGMRTFFVRFADGTVVPIAADGQPAPGAGGLKWSGSFFNTPLLAGSHAAFLGGLEKQDSIARDGIWIYRKGGSTTLVAKTGDPVPGMPGHAFDRFDDPALNALGMVVFGAQTDLGQRGIWFYDGRTIQLLVAVGDFLTAGPGDSRRAAAVSFRTSSSSQGGYRSSLNDRGQFVFGASFNTGALGTAVLGAGQKS